MGVPYYRFFLSRAEFHPFLGRFAARGYLLRFHPVPMGRGGLWGTRTQGFTLGNFHFLPDGRRSTRFLNRSCSPFSSDGGISSAFRVGFAGGLTTRIKDRHGRIYAFAFAYGVFAAGWGL